MNPLAALYGAVVSARNDLYDRGSLQVRRLDGPVVSVGNIRVGGAGKTPFVIALGELLKQRGVAFDVLSRGYRRATRGVALVDPQGSPREFGDEPLLIARKLGVPVIVGEDRYAAGLLAERRFGPQLHLLDDGFQHRRLARDFDIVLVTESDVHDRLLPAGRLREPLSSLARADAVVLTRAMPVDGLPLEDQQVWRVTHGIVAPKVSGSCIAFCGIGQPQNFFSELSAAGITLVSTRSFSDHHVYRQTDIRQLLELGKRHSAAAFLTTEKDAINLSAYQSELKPIYVVPLQTEIDNAEMVLETLLRRIAKHRTPA